MDASPWNSLEVVKISVAILTPLLLLGLGFLVNRAVRRVEDAQWRNRKLIEQRLEVYGRLAPGLNDLYCFVRFVGDYRELTPPEAVALKRTLDKEFHVNKFLFSGRFEELYQHFVGLLFEMNVDFGTDARIRLNPEDQRREMGDEPWEPGWGKRFSPPPERSDRREIAAAYNDFMKHFAEELGVTERQDAKAA